MYDEYERAEGARSGSGVSLLGWLGIAAVLVSLVGATGAFFAYRYVKGQVQEIAEQLRPLESLVTMRESPMVGAVVARTLAAAGSAEDFGADDLQEVITRAFDSSPRSAQSGEETIEGQLRIRTGRGDFTADLDADDDRGRLVVRRPDGAVIVDVSADEDGGRLVIGADGDEVRIEAGDRSQRGHPAWVAEFGGAPRDARSIVSGRLGDVAFGAVTWTTSEEPNDLVARVRERLEDEGWQFEADHDLRDGGASSSSTIARLPEAGRTIVIAAGTEDGLATVVQGWAEKRPGG
jgi:hypothetical protein